jgi:trehalose 6-phosphate phosphatase
MDNRHWTQHTDALLRLINHERFGLISDFDGTLSPFVTEPERAIISAANAKALDSLSGKGVIIALISGRSARDLRSRFERPWAVYYGNHGMEFWRDGLIQVAPDVQPWYETLQKLLDDFGAADMPGVFIENKGITASFHYRAADDPAEARRRLSDRLQPLCDRYQFSLSEGQFIWEVKPPVDLNKGSAAEAIVRDFCLESALFLGDDLTDVHAMRRLRALAAEPSNDLEAQSVGIIHPTTMPAVVETCDLTAYGIEDVERLLDWISQQRSSSPPGNTSQ